MNSISRYGELTASIVSAEFSRSPLVSPVCIKRAGNFVQFRANDGKVEPTHDRSNLLNLLISGQIVNHNRTVQLDQPFGNWVDTYIVGTTTSRFYQLLAVD